MRLLALLLSSLLLTSGNALADAIKYRQANGKVLITNQPIDDTSAKTVTVHRDEHIPLHQQQAAANDLQRQKEFLATRERENQRPGGYATNSNGQNPQNNIEKLQRCLMAVTSTFGLSPGQQASRKVNCYSGTVGLNNECQHSVAATMRISTREEEFYKSQCPR